MYTSNNKNQLFSGFFTTTTITVTQQGGQRDQYCNDSMTDDKTVSKTPLLTSQKHYPNCFYSVIVSLLLSSLICFKQKVTTELQSITEQLR